MGRWRWCRASGEGSRRRREAGARSWCAAKASGQRQQGTRRKRKKTNMRGLPVRGAKWTLEAGVNCRSPKSKW